MKSIKSHHSGITLLEVILVTAIASSIMILGMKAYTSWQLSLQYTQLRYNVNTLLQAMGQYYSANCYGSYNSAGTTFTAGVLNPNYPTSTAAPIPMNTYTLQSNGFIKLANINNNIPLLNNSADVSPTYFTAYVLQFNPHTSTMAAINACTSVGNCTTVTPNTSIANSFVFLWGMQVAVKINIPSGYSSAQQLTLMTNYKNIMAADCTSTLSGGIVTPCAGATNSSTNDYLVFERMPSFASAETTTNLWQTMPMIKQFNLQYSHDQMYELINSSLGAQGSKIYYLCGG